MSKKERGLIVIVLIIISFLTIGDIIIDSKDGVDYGHLFIELGVAIVSMFGIIYLLKGTFKLKNSLENERELSQKNFEDSQQWREKSKKYLDGLAHSIDEQLSEWELTKSEKEVAFLLLKGFSFKEIGVIRSTTEKTARAQSAVIYSKAGLGNRSQLSAFFLEDFLAPTYHS